MLFIVNRFHVQGFSVSEANQTLTFDFIHSLWELRPSPAQEEDRHRSSYSATEKTMNLISCEAQEHPSRREISL
jgi:hypothetical protein